MINLFNRDEGQIVMAADSQSHIDTIVKVASSYGLRLFGGALRDQVRREEPTDLDFLIDDQYKYDMSESALREVALHKLDDMIEHLETDGYELKLESGDPTEYSSNEVISYQVTHSDGFSIKIDLVYHSVNECMELDLDVNGLIASTNTMRLGARGGLTTCGMACHPSLDIEVIKNCRAKRFNVMFDRSTKMPTPKHHLDTPRVIKWILGDYRIVKMLKRGWLPVGCESEDREAIIQYLANQNRLAYTITDDKREPLLSVPTGTCGICKESIDGYAHRLVCCNQHIHVDCSLQYVRSNRDSRYLNCSLCRGDPYGWGTSGELSDKFTVWLAYRIIEGWGIKHMQVDLYDFERSAPVDAKRYDFTYGPKGTITDCHIIDLDDGVTLDSRSFNATSDSYQYNKKVRNGEEGPTFNKSHNILLLEINRTYLPLISTRKETINIANGETAEEQSDTVQATKEICA